MLDKTPGAVACGHCQTLGADDLCRYCRRPVHRGCLESDRCQVPHPWERMLGRGRRLRDIDEDGAIGRVHDPFDGDQVVELGSGTAVGAWPKMEHEGLPVQLFSEQALGRGVLVRRAATYTFEDRSDGDSIVVYHAPLLARARLSAGRMEQVELVRRPPHGFDPDRLVVARDGRTALVSASRFDLVDIEGKHPTRVVDLKGEMMLDLAISSELGLAVAAMFGRLGCYDLKSGELRGSIPFAGEEVTAVVLGGGRVAAVTSERRLVVKEVGPGAPDGWPDVLRAEVDFRGRLAPGELALSHDGRLAALRHRRKQAVVVDLAGGGRQVLAGHTDKVIFVRFVAGGRVLVTADDDDRVRFWPRAGDRIVSGD